MEAPLTIQLPGVDLAEARARLVDDVPFIVSLLHELVEQALEAERSLALSSDKPDFEDALRKLHQIRGGAANLAAKRIEHHTSRLEMLVKNLHRTAQSAAIAEPALLNASTLRDAALIRSALKSELLTLQASLKTLLQPQDKLEERSREITTSQELESHTKEGTRQNKIRILVIDDSDTMRSFVEATLQTGFPGVEIDEASDGLTGFRKLAESPPDLVICDLQMPEFDGIKLLQMRESRPELAEIPFIMLTADDDIDRKTEVLHRGASDYITKPFHGKELIARAHIHLRQKKLKDELREARAMLSAISKKAVPK